MTLAKHDHLYKAAHISVASSVGVLIVATIMLNSFTTPHHGNVLSQTTAANRTARTAAYALTIKDVTQAPTDSVSGLKRVTVALNIDNLTSDIIQISPGLQMFLRTSTGQQYNLTAKYLAPGIDIGGPVAAGAQTSLNVDFDLPASSTPTTFIYQPDAGSTPSQIKL